MALCDNLDFDDTYERLRKCLTGTGDKWKWWNRPKRRAKVAILLIALRNGCRSSEAIDAFNSFLETGITSVEVRVRKRGFKYISDGKGGKKRASQSKLPEKPVMRVCIIPDEVSQKLPAFEGEPNLLTQFCVDNFGFRVHALRYAFITHMGKKGIAPQVIAKITQHATLGEILRYTEQVAANDLLQTGVL